MKTIPVLFNPKQYNNLHALLHEAYERSTDTILTCTLETEEIEELMEVLG